MRRDGRPRVGQISMRPAKTQEGTVMRAAIQECRGPGNRVPQSRKSNRHAGSAAGCWARLSTGPISPFPQRRLARWRQARIRAHAAGSMHSSLPRCICLFAGARRFVAARACAAAAASIAAASRTNAGGSTPCASAQANFSRIVKQQQPCQHWSAFMQPQGRSMQGNGLLRSLTGAAAIAGSGRPVTSTS